MLESLAVSLLWAQAPQARPAQTCDYTYEHALSEDRDGVVGRLRIQIIGETCDAGFVLYEVFDTQQRRILQFSQDTGSHFETANLPTTAPAELLTWLGQQSADDGDRLTTDYFTFGVEAAEAATCLDTVSLSYSAYLAATQTALPTLELLTDGGIRRVYWFDGRSEQFEPLGIHCFERDWQ